MNFACAVGENDNDRVATLIGTKKGKHRFAQARSEDFQGQTFKSNWPKVSGIGYFILLCIRTKLVFTLQGYCQKSIPGELPQ